jgi:PAS domain S-box-containing protein
MKKATSASLRKIRPLLSGGRARTRSRARAAKPTPGPSADRHQSELSQILSVLAAFKKGEFSARLPVKWTGTLGEVASAFNEVAALMSASNVELTRVTRVVGNERKLNERLVTSNLTGGWGERAHAINTLIASLIDLMREQGPMARTQGDSVPGSALAASPVSQVRVVAGPGRKGEQTSHETERLRQIDSAEHHRLLTEGSSRLEAEPKLTRFFTLPMGMLAIVRFDGYFAQLNPTWEKTLGFTEAELRAKPFLEFAHPEDQIKARKQLMHLRASLGTGYFENRFHCKDGSTRWLGWTAAPFAEQKLFYIFAGDISARKQSEQEMENVCAEFHRHLIELGGINKQLEAFTYSVSHDLRAPLRSIRGFTETLLEDYGPKLEPKARNHLECIGSSAKYMDTMLLDLLDYSRVNQSKCKPRLLNVEAAVNKVIAQFQSDIKAKKVLVDIQTPLARAWGHLPIFTQIVANLVDNALKFTQENITPRIRIWTESRADRVRLFVEDNGLGIAPAHQQRVFGLFVRLHPAPSHSGTGVGLALVQKGAERMGGSVGVESQWHKGSRFWLELNGEGKQNLASPRMEGSSGGKFRPKP